MAIKYKNRKRRETVKTKTVIWEGFKRTSETIIQTRLVEDIEHDHEVPMLGDKNKYKYKKQPKLGGILEEVGKCIRDKRRSKKDKQKRLTQ